MENEKLITELQKTSSRIANIRASELSLIQELIKTVQAQEEEYDKLKEAKRAVIGPAETKKYISELEDQVKELTEELQLKNTAIAALQKKLQEGSVTKNDKPNSGKSGFNWFRRANSN